MSRSRGARAWLALPAVVAVACVAAFGAVEFGPRIWGSAAPDAPGTVPEPGTTVTVMTAAELRAAIEAERGGGLAPRYVVADVSIDASHKPAPVSRECDPIGPCEVIGTLAGFDTGDPVAVHREDGLLPPAADPASLAAPVALLVTGHGPIEFLGHVTAAPSGSMTWTVADASAATGTAPDEQVIGVGGWLEDVQSSCGPVPEFQLPAPFVCDPRRSYLTPLPEEVATGGGGYWTITPPRDGVPLQAGAYSRLAPDPEWPDFNSTPRWAVYLLRMVAYDGPGCTACRGWLAVGRLDAAAVQSSAPPGPIVRSPAELEQLLSVDRSDWVGRLVAVDGTIDPGVSPPCPALALCRLGELRGSVEDVWATPPTISMLPSEAAFQTQGVMTLRVLSDGLEYLGYPGFNVDGSFRYTVAQLADPQIINHAPLMTVDVTGWLVRGPIYSCPTVIDDGAGTPFQNCPPPDWVSGAEPTANDGVEWTKVGDYVLAQPGAYDEFAADRKTVNAGTLMEPRLGTYVLRLIAVTVDGARKVGWQMIGRIDP
jgi:hypothetical protein